MDFDTDVAMMREHDVLHVEGDHFTGEAWEFNIEVDSFDDKGKYRISFLVTSSSRRIVALRWGYR